MQIGGRCRWHRVAARLRRQSNSVACREVPRSIIRLNIECVRRCRCEVADVDPPFAIPVYVRGWAAVQQNAVGWRPPLDIVPRGRPGQRDL